MSSFHDITNKILQELCETVATDSVIDLSYLRSIIKNQKTIADKSYVYTKRKMTKAIEEGYFIQIENKEATRFSLTHQFKRTSKTFTPIKLALDAEREIEDSNPVTTNLGDLLSTFGVRKVNSVSLANLNKRVHSSE
jgi:hypothetical protein